MYKVLVTSKSFAKYNPEIADELETKGIQLIRAAKSNMSSEEIAEIIEEYDGIICGIDCINESVIQAGKKLKIIHMNGTGIDHIDVAAASSRRIAVGNCPGANAEAVAELNLAILLAEARGIVKHTRLMSEGRWEREVGVELSGKVIGILGLGAIGRHLVELLQGFHMEILGYDIKPDYEWCKSKSVTLVDDCNVIFRKSDFISLNLPLLDSTRYIINKEALAMMKKNVILVNTARGGLINTEDLIEALKNKQIRGAALDAFEQEPLPMDSELRQLGITLTPHLGASSRETMLHTSRLIAEHLEEVLLRNDFSNMVNGSECKIQ